MPSDEVGRSCAGCGGTDGLIFFEVRGWEQRRGQGGTNAVALRELTGRVMCNACMSLRKSGINPKQGQLGVESDAP